MPAGSAQLLTVKVAGETLALPAADVAEIIRPLLLTRVPHGPPSLLGIANFRSSALPVVSLAVLLGRKSAGAGAGRIVVIAKGAPVGLLVDEISALTERSEEQQIDLDALLAREFQALGRKVSVQRPAATHRVDAPGPADSAGVAFICFVVAGQDYALPMDQVLEVTSVPAGIAEVPGTDDAMVGVGELRGGLVPLVSLRVLLGLKAEAAEGTSARIVLMRFGGHIVGLVSDGIKAILRVGRERLDAVPPVLSRGRGEALIEAICRVDGGRLVSVLAADRLFDAETSARIMAGSAQGGSRMQSGPVQDAREQFVVFELGEEQYGLPIASVDEIVRLPEQLTRVPRAPAFVEGIMHLRGRMVPVIDQRERFAVRSERADRNRRVVVVTIDGLQTGFAVDRVSEILAIPASELKAAPELETGSTQVFDRVAMIEREGRTILLVDPRALLDRAERDVLAALNA